LPKLTEHPALPTSFCSIRYVASFIEGNWMTVGRATVSHSLVEICERRLTLFSRTDPLIPINEPASVATSNGNRETNRTIIEYY
jgi:hypothetical protein